MIGKPEGKDLLLKKGRKPKGRVWRFMENKKKGTIIRDYGVRWVLAGGGQLRDRRHYNYDG